MTDNLGPSDGTNAATQRPTDSTSFNALDTWFAPCSSSTAQDGTQLTANTLNRWIANMRALWRGAGALISGAAVNPDAYSDAGLLSAVLQLIQRGQPNVGVDAGAVNALVVNPTPALLEYKRGVRLWVAPANALTAAATINVSGLGPASLTWADGSAFVAGDWPAGAPGLIYCTGSAWVLLSAPGRVATTTARGVGRVATNAEAAAGATVGSAPGFITPEQLGAARNASGQALAIGTIVQAVGANTIQPRPDTIGATFTSAAGNVAATYSAFNSNTAYIPNGQVWTVVASQCLTLGGLISGITSGPTTSVYTTLTTLMRTA
jgi:hypothetical protein